MKTGSKKKRSTVIPKRTHRQSKLIKKFNEDLDGYRKFVDESSDSSDSSEEEDCDYEILLLAKEYVMKSYTPIYKKYVDDNKSFFKNDFKHHVSQFMPKRYKTYNSSPVFIHPLTPHPISKCDSLGVPTSSNSTTYPCIVQMFPSSDLRPRMPYYTHIDRNIRVEDTLRLSHFPYVAETEETSQFFFELRKAYPEGIHGERRGWGLLITDELLYLLLESVVKEWEKTKKPKEYIFIAIAKLFPNKLTSRELEDAYPTLIRRFRGKSTVKKTTRSVTEVDHSISSLYCGKCHQFHCELHGIDNFSGISANKDVIGDEKEGPDPCSSDCYKLKAKKKGSENACNKGEVEPLKGGAQHIFELFLGLDEFTSCTLSKTLSYYDPAQKRTCREIHLLSRKLAKQKKVVSPSENKDKKKTQKDVASGYQFLARGSNGKIDNSAKLIPCDHEGACTNCVCSQENTPCTKFCKCNEDCRRKLKGCVCLPGQCGSNLCPCYLAKWECDPDTCRSCVCGSSNFNLSSLEFNPSPDPELNYYGDLDSEEEITDFVLKNLEDGIRRRTDSLMSTDSARPDSLSGDDSDQSSLKLNRTHTSSINSQSSVTNDMEKTNNGENTSQSDDNMGETVVKKSKQSNDNDSLPSFFSADFSDDCVEGWLKSLELPKHFSRLPSSLEEVNDKKIVKKSLSRDKENSTQHRKIVEGEQTDIRITKRKKFGMQNMCANNNKHKVVLKSIFGDNIFKTKLPVDADEVKEEERCNNCRIQDGNFKKLKVGISSVAGYGCFLCEPAAKGDLIAEYTGEVVSRWEAERRGLIYDEFKCSFIFALNNSQSVDATRMGNTIRFANHSDNGNCYSQIIVVNGEHRIGIFAKTDLASGEEIFFDYQYNTNCKKKYVPVDCKDV